MANIVHPRLSEQRELKAEPAVPDKPKIRISKDGNLGRQNDYLTFKLDKICYIMWHVFEKTHKRKQLPYPLLGLICKV